MAAQLRSASRYAKGLYTCAQAGLELNVAYWYADAPAGRVIYVNDIACCCDDTLTPDVCDHHAQSHGHELALGAHEADHPASSAG